MIPKKPVNEEGLDHKSTRRNVIALAGILASTVAAATIAGTTSAFARSRGGWGGGGHKAGRHWAGRGGRACFLSGTNILTEDGESGIEKLKVGDLVQTLSGQTRAIKQVISWTARRQTNQHWAEDAAPIKVCRSALSPNLPHRDLYLSRQHAVYLDGVLVRIKDLVNGRTILRCSNYGSESLTYYHLELEDHQIILAEGAAVESKLSLGMTPFAPLWRGDRKAKIASRLRSAISPWIDKRTPIDKVQDRIGARGETISAA